MCRPASALSDIVVRWTKVGRPARALFSVVGYRAARNRRRYDVKPEGQQLLMIRENATTQVAYVEN